MTAKTKTMLLKGIPPYVHVIAHYKRERIWYVVAKLPLDSLPRANEISILELAIRKHALPHKDPIPQKCALMRFSPRLRIVRPRNRIQCPKPARKG